MEPGDIVSHNEFCAREGRMLQHGMNFRVSRTHSVILMSVRKGAPYEDEVLNGGKTLIYEGHDVPRTKGIDNPKKYDQPEFTLRGKLTPNGKFAQAAREFKEGHCSPERVRVYEKLKDGIWVYVGDFDLVDVFTRKAAGRNVFKFQLEIVSSPPTRAEQAPGPLQIPHNRMIPGAIKREVYKRDKGCCVICGSDKNLHFDHDFPFSKGGTSISAANIRLLCMRHNLEKRDKIE